MRRLAVMVVLAVLAAAATATAGPKTKLAEELVEWMARKFTGRVAAHEAGVLTRRVEGLLARHGDEAAAALRRSGPRVVQVADEAGEHAAAAVKAIARHGDDGVAFVATRPAALALASKHGDDCAAVLVKHKGVAEGVVEAAGEPAVRALAAVSPRGGRLVAMMHQGGELAAVGRTSEVLAVVARWGDAAAEFIWKNKGALAVGAVLATFLADPEPYLTGAKALAAEVVKPLAAVPGKVADGIVGGTNWTVILLAVLVIGGGVAAVRAWARRGGRHPNSTEVKA